MRALGPPYDKPTVADMEARIAELEAERDRLQTLWFDVGVTRMKLLERAVAENALLLKALESVRPSCRAPGCWCPESLGYADDRRHSDACIAARAALARIPEAKPPHE